MSLYEMCLLVAHLSRTPLPMVWDRFTLSDVCRVASYSSSVLPFLNSLAGAEGGTDKPFTGAASDAIMSALC